MELVMLLFLIIKKYIKLTLDPVLKQSYTKIEVIITYDDNSMTDLKFIKQIIKKDKRVHIILNKKLRCRKIKKYWD